MIDCYQWEGCGNICHVFSGVKPVIVVSFAHWNWNQWLNFRESGPDSISPEVFTYILYLLWRNLCTSSGALSSNPSVKKRRGGASYTCIVLWRSWHPSSSCSNLPWSDTVKNNFDKSKSYVARNNPSVNWGQRFLCSIFSIIFCSESLTPEDNNL